MESPATPGRFRPSKVRVTLNDRTQLEMEQPRIVGDTLRGLVKGGTDDSLVERDVLLANIATLEVSKTNAGNSVLLGLGIVAGILVVAAAVFVITCDDLGEVDC